MVILEADRVIFRSRAAAIKPVIRFIKSGGRERGADSLVIYDKYVGRAAALLMSLVSPKLVCTPVLSESGEQTLKQFDIPFQADRRVKYLMGIASADMCKWEKMTLGKTPEEFWAMLTASE